MRGRLAAGVAVLLFSAACGSGQTTVAPKAETGPTSSLSPRSSATEVAPLAAPLAKALDFEAAAVDGPAVNGRALAGEPVALWFWAPW